MSFIWRALEKLTEPKERGGTIMWDCPLCPALFHSEKAASAHIARCRGE